MTQGLHRLPLLLSAWLMALLSALSGAAEIPLTPIAAVRALSREDLAKAPVVRLRGVVTFRNVDTFVIQDDSAGIYVNQGLARKWKIWAGDEAVSAALRAGSVVEVEGVMDPGGYSPPVLLRQVRILGEAPLPLARPTVAGRFFRGVEDSQRVEVRGVVQGLWVDGAGVNLVLDAVPGRFLARVPNASLEQAEAWVDAEVRLEGVAVSRFNTRGEFIMPTILLNRAEDLQVEKPPPSLPFDAPLVAMQDIDRFRVEPLKGHRQRVQGVVIHSEPGHLFYLQDGRTGLRVETRSPLMLQQGDRVEVAGFVDRTRIVRGLCEAVVRKIGTGQVAAAEPIHPDQIIAINAESVARGLIANPGDYDGRLITFTAFLVDVNRSDTGEWRLTLKGEASSITSILHDANPRALAALRPGSALALTGIAQVSFANPLTTAQSPERVDVLLRTVADIVILRRPSWWTRERVMVALGGVVLSFFGAIAWVGQLRRRVQVQAVTIAEAMRTHRDSELELTAARGERFRLAADLHDSLQQHLTGASYRIEAGLMRMGEVPEAVREQFTAARAALDRTRSGLRACMVSLRGIEEGPAEFPALVQHSLGKVDHWPRDAVDVITTGEAFPLSRHVMGSLLLFLQEAVGNAFKHGAPGRVSVQLDYTPDELTLSVTDDGRGFDLTAAQRHATGLGLETMRHRLRWLGGRAEITSQPGEGTRIVARLSRIKAQAAEETAGDPPGSAPL